MQQCTNTNWKSWFYGTWISYTVCTCIPSGFLRRCSEPVVQSDNIHFWGSAICHIAKHKANTAAGDKDHHRPQCKRRQTNFKATSHVSFRCNVKGIAYHYSMSPVWLSFILLVDILKNVCMLVLTMKVNGVECCFVPYWHSLDELKHSSK